MRTRVSKLNKAQHVGMMLLSTAVVLPRACVGRMVECLCCRLNLFSNFYFLSLEGQLVNGELSVEGHADVDGGLTDIESARCRPMQNALTSLRQAYLSCKSASRLRETHAMRTGMRG